MLQSFVDSDIALLYKEQLIEVLWAVKTHGSVV